MPAVEVSYAGPIRAAIRCSNERLEMPADATIGELLEELVRRHGPAVRGLLFDSADNLLPQAMIIIDGVAVRKASATIGQGVKVRILVMSPAMSGG